jgi:group I intron endonuclease
MNLSNLFKMYVGQSENILGRMNNYLNNSYLKDKKNNQVFPRALLKYGQNNFCLIIIEYIPIDLLDTREIFWIALLKPYYNLTKGGRKGKTGFKHSASTLYKLRELAKNRKLSAKTKSLISASTTGANNPFFGLTHSKYSIQLISLAKSKAQIFIYNEMKVLLTIVTSATLLTKSIKSSYSTIMTTIKTGSLFRGGWYFTKTPFSPLPQPFGQGGSGEGDKPKFLNLESKEYLQLMEDIIKNKHILKAIFVFNAENQQIIKRYDGLVECAKDLKISHNTINTHLDTGKPFKGYLFSSHKLLK